MPKVKPKATTIKAKTKTKPRKPREFRVLHGSSSYLRTEMVRRIEFDQKLKHYKLHLTNGSVLGFSCVYDLYRETRKDSGEYRQVSFPEK